MKESLKRMLSFFQPTDPTSKYYESYSHRFLKIGILTIIIILLSTRNYYLDIREPFNTWIGILTLPIVLVCLIGIYVSISEVLVGEFKKIAPNETAEPKVIPIKDIIKCVEENDIIEFVICFENKLIKCGASSDSTPTRIFDKRYYIEQKEYLEIEEFASALSQYGKNGVVEVITVDGLGPDTLGLNTPRKNKKR